MYLNEYGCQCSNIPVRTITDAIADEVLQDVAAAEAEFAWALQHDGTEEEVVAAQVDMITARRTYRNWVSETAEPDDTTAAYEDFRTLGR